MAKNISQHIHGNVNPYEGLVLENSDEQGWSSTGGCFDEIFEKIKPKTVIEVGTWKGASALNMARLGIKHGISREEFEIVCVDTFLGSHEHLTFMCSFQPGNGSRRHGRPTIYEIFLSNVIRNEFTDIITPFPIDSYNGGVAMQSWKIEADLIYIDGGHDFELAKNDFMLYAPLLRNGGYILIDDWHHQPIREAAQDVFGDKVFDLHGKGAWIK